MDTNLRHLDKVEKEGWSMGEVMKLVRSMVKEAQLIRNSTLDFAAAIYSKPPIANYIKPSAWAVIE